MITNTNVAGSGLAPPWRPGTHLVAAIDVEWSKNYRIRGSNVPFCYSLAWLALPGDASVSLDTVQFWYACAYVEDASQVAELVDGADAALACLMSHATLIAGHQLCSDLAVLAAVAATQKPAIATAADAWRQRHKQPTRAPRFLDTRYDTGHILSCQSRRLVDVCADLSLDVTQPELRGTSMTALHRRWLEFRDNTAREKITVLNLRHSLSTALVAARAADLGCWQPGLNVSRLLAAELNGRFGWLNDPVFTTLLGDT